MLRRAVLVACCILWMIPTAARRSVQATINEQFAALAEKGLAPITTSSELRAQLKPSELCYAADNLPALSRLSIPRCDPIERQAMSNALQLEVAEKNRCWAAQPSTAPPPAAANMMSTDGRSSIAAAPPAEASFETLLARWRLRPAALAALDTTPPVPHARQVLLVGDSTMRMMASALTCNLLRRLGPHESMEADGWNIEYLPFMVSSFVRSFLPFRPPPPLLPLSVSLCTSRSLSLPLSPSLPPSLSPSLPPCHTHNTTQAYQPGFKSSEAARAAFENRLRALSASGGVVVLGIGLHYNNAEPMTRNTVVEFREAMYYGAQGRPEYHRDLVHFVSTAHTCIYYPHSYYVSKILISFDQAPFTHFPNEPTSSAASTSTRARTSTRTRS